MYFLCFTLILVVPNVTVAAVKKPAPEPVEAQHAEEVGFVGIALVSGEVIIIVMLDFVTFTKQWVMLKRNIRSLRRSRKVAAQGQSAGVPIEPAGKEGFVNHNDLASVADDHGDMALKRMQYTGYTEYTESVLFPKEAKKKKILVAS